MKKRRTRAEQAADNGRRLAEAAQAVFLKRGYHGATLDQVAEAAGLTKGAVYARFDSKAELFLSLLEERIAYRIAAIGAAPPPTGDHDDALVHQSLERMRNEAAWSLLVIEFRVAAARDRALNARYTAQHERLIDAVAERFEANARAGDLTMALSGRDAARLAIAYNNGVLLERAAAGDKLSEASAARGMVALFDGLITQRGRATRPARRSS